LSRWALGEYIFEALVIVGCAGELIADLGRLPSRCKRRIERWSTMLLVAALSMELICLVRTNQLSESVIGSLGDKAGEADSKAKKAIANSSNALSQAQDALTKAGKAQGKADTVAKQADDLLRKYIAAERDLLALKAKNAPRRLSSEQKELLRRRIATFSIKTIFVECKDGGRETLDFELDFADALLGLSQLNMQYLSSCDVVLGGAELLPPIEIVAGVERQGDSDILCNALVEIGINKKDIATNTSANKSLLILAIGPKPP
jgi:ElaB/YqjD/DUF883 family membrane-anchored ribosome-binding protein